jgi:hypothetical protein
VAVLVDDLVGPPSFHRGEIDPRRDAARAQVSQVGQRVALGAEDLRVAAHRRLARVTQVGGDDEGLVEDRRAHQAPAGVLPGKRLGDRRDHDDDLGPAQGEHPGGLDKGQVVADQQADSAEARVERYEPFPRPQKLLGPVHVRRVVMGQLLGLGVVEVGPADQSVAGLLETAHDQRLAVLVGQGLDPAKGRSEADPLFGGGLGLGVLFQVGHACEIDGVAVGGELGKGNSSLSGFSRRMRSIWARTWSGLVNRSWPTVTR